MKLISFNINGLRARPHQLAEIIAKYEPDVIGLQEIKVSDPDFPIQELSKYPYHIHYHGQKGHYGVALLTRQAPIRVVKGLPNDSHDAQRRLILAEIPSSIGNIVVINGYFPQGESRDHPVKFPAKERFYCELTEYVSEQLQHNPRLILMGDMNICGHDNDIGLKEVNRKRWLAAGKCSFLPEERHWLSELSRHHLFDTFRHHYPDESKRFSWFDYRSKGFEDNIGLRIDLILASEALRHYCHAAGIDYDIRAMDKPSDHAPIWADFQLTR